MIYFIIVLCFVVNISAQKLPPFIKKCSISSNEYHTCFVKHANEALPYFLKGDKKHHIPSFNPLKLDQIIFNPTETLQITFTNIETRGFDEAQVLEGNYDKIKKEFSYKVKIPNFDVKSNYEATGNILILPFNGNGANHIQLKNLIYKHTFQIEPSEFNKNDYIKLVNSRVEYVVDKVTYHFDNLFNGNKELGDQLNLFMNENQAELNEEFRPVFRKTINSVSERILSDLMQNLKFDDLFLP